MPPLNALRAFEVAARHKGYAGAADELCVNRGAISRHVKLLEEHLGVRLFKRLPNGIELTDSGRKFLPVLTEAGNADHAVRTHEMWRDGPNHKSRPSSNGRWVFPKKMQQNCR